MLQEISKITGIPFNDNPATLFQLRRISNKLPLDIQVNLFNRSFVNAVKAAAAEVDAEGPITEESIAKQPEGPRPLKIKSSPKGKRIQHAAPNGVRYSFGPVWNKSVMKGKGIAIAEANREKLEFQAELLGVEGPFDNLDSVTLSMAMATIMKVKGFSEEGVDPAEAA